MKIGKSDDLPYMVRGLEEAMKACHKDPGLTPGREAGKSAAARGEGLFPISCKADRAGKVLKGLRDKGVQLNDEKPRHLFGNSYAFIRHPAKPFGALTKVPDGEFGVSEAS